MRRLVITTLFIGVSCLIPTASWADLTPYNQDFEGLDREDTGALANDGWMVFGNVFGPGFSSYLYGYGPFPAPNDGGGFSAIVEGEGGPEQGTQQLSIFSDYNNGDHANGNIIEANVFQEQMVGAADVGGTWDFEFDAKRGNLEGETTALAFFKTLDPANGYALTNFVSLDMTGVPDTWGGYSLSIFIDPSLEGQILQFGFLSQATLYQGSGVFYDNISFGVAPLSVSVDIKPGSCRNPINSRAQGVLPVVVLGTADFDVNDIDVSTLRLEGVAPLRWSHDDVAAPFAGELTDDVCGCTEAGPDGLVDLKLKFKNQEIIAAIGDSDRLTLTGALLDGTPIEGQECVVFVGRGRGADDTEDEADPPSISGKPRPSVPGRR